MGGRGSKKGSRGGEGRSGFHLLDGKGSFVSDFVVRPFHFVGTTRSSGFKGTREVRLRVLVTVLLAKPRICRECRPDLGLSLSA